MIYALILLTPLALLGALTLGAVLVQFHRARTETREGRAERLSRAAMLALYAGMTEAGGKNYWTVVFEGEDEAWTVTLQRAGGKTPAHRIAELEAELARLSVPAP